MIHVAAAGLRLEAGGYEVRIVPADDLDAAVGVMQATVAEMRGRFPDVSLLADYTGGTKTMTAALVVIAIESEHVELRFVTRVGRAWRELLFADTEQHAKTRDPVAPAKRSKAALAKAASHLLPEQVSTASCCRTSRWPSRVSDACAMRRGISAIGSTATSRPLTPM